MFFALKTQDLESKSYYMYIYIVLSKEINISIYLNVLNSLNSTFTDLNKTNTNDFCPKLRQPPQGPQTFLAHLGETKWLNFSIALGSKLKESKNITNHKQWTSSTKIYWTKSTKKKQHVHFHVFHPLLYLQLLSVVSISSSLEVTGPSVAHKQWRQKPEKSGKSLRFTDRRLPQKGPEISWSCQELASILAS